MKTVSCSNLEMLHTVLELLQFLGEGKNYTFIEHFQQRNSKYDCFFSFQDITNFTLPIITSLIYSEPYRHLTDVTSYIFSNKIITYNHYF